MPQGPIYEKSYAFALEVLRFCRRYERPGVTAALISQFFRAGTGVGANVREASAAQSRRDFLSKMGIASKEAREAGYWLELMRDGGGFPREEVDRLLSLCDELIRLLTSIVKTSRQT